MDALNRGRRPVVLLLVLALAGCGDAPEAATVTPDAPALPDGVLLQLSVPETGEIYRIAGDGRFLVTTPGQDEHVEPPRSKYERGTQAVSPTGLDRLRAALDKAGFFSLPDRIETGDCVGDDVVIRNSGRKVLRRTVVVSARDGDKVHTVEGKGDFAAPCTLAELEPIYRALDLEALGDWQNE